MIRASLLSLLVLCASVLGALVTSVPVQLSKQKGGSGGGSFSMESLAQNPSIRIVAVRVWRDEVKQYLRRLQVEYSSGETVTQGGATVNSRWSKHELEVREEEHIVRVYGQVGDYLRGLGLETNTGRRMSVTTRRGGKRTKFDFRAPHGWALQGFFGRNGLWLDAIGAIWRQSNVECSTLSGNQDPKLLADPASVTLASNATYSCSTGYRLVGQATQTCTAAGTMSHDLPSCEAVCESGCENGGICVAPNTCECSDVFTGDVCQTQRNSYITSIVPEADTYFSDGYVRGLENSLKLFTHEQRYGLQSFANDAVIRFDLQKLRESPVSLFSAHLVLFLELYHNPNNLPLLLYGCTEKTSLYCNNWDENLFSYYGSILWFRNVNFSLVAEINAAENDTVVDITSFLLQANQSLANAATLRLRLGEDKGFFPEHLAQFASRDSSFPSRRPRLQLNFGGDCGQLSAPAFGSVHYTNTSAHGVATYSCNEGYSIVTPVSRTCGVDAVWSPLDEQPVCTPNVPEPTETS